jgi:hypothetical protein
MCAQLNSKACFNKVHKPTRTNIACWQTANESKMAANAAYGEVTSAQMAAFFTDTETQANRLTHE